MTQQILSTSDDAASLKTVTGWVDRHGQFFGEDERTARWSGCTHIPCPECGAPTERGRVKCYGCREKADLARFLALPAKPYEWGMVYSDSYERYFDDLDDAADWAAGEGTDVESMRLRLCDPVYPSELDDDHWSDDLPEDGTLTECAPDLAEAVAAVNRAIAQMRKDRKPMSWTPAEFRVALAEAPHTPTEAE